MQLLKNSPNTTAVDDTTAWDVSIESVTAPGSVVDATAAGETAILTVATQNSDDTAAAAQMDKPAAAKSSHKPDITAVHTLASLQAASKDVVAVDGDTAASKICR
ncbi:hypothetical protein ACH5RR_022947 [Cinchona calisaya]|uniref:Uncharacterized protein n=1 Tax=Cinchona calisaya TaxID=153742 RepID=A0ABD2ZCN6_9GENT